MEHPFRDTDSTIPVGRVSVHPLVIFAVLEHFAHRKSTQARVIGTLMGRWKHVHNEKILEICDCFAMPHEEKDAQDVSLGKDHHEAMAELRRSFDSSLDVVGWYATSNINTGTFLDVNSSILHSFLSSETAPIHLVVDTFLTNDSLQIKAFVSNSLTLQDKTLVVQFKPLRAAIEAPDAQGDVALRRALSASSGQTIGSSDELKQTQRAAVGALLATLDAVLDDGRPEEASRVAELLSDMPHLDHEVFKQSLQEDARDLLMVSFLANLTRAQIAVAEKLASVR